MTREQSAPGGRSPLPGVFISYRREFDAGWAPWLYDKLSDHFGANRIFMDLDSIAAGDDFVKVITNSVASCRVLIILIGKDWAGALDAEGRRRLDDRGDFVRLEIESALKHGVRVIPLLIEGATMPPHAELPGTLAPIVYRQALTLTATHRRYDAENLVKAVERALDQPKVEPTQVPSPPVVPPAPPPSQLQAAVQPTVARGLRSSNIEVRLTNAGQAPRSVVLRTTALPDRVRITPDRVRVQVPAGATTKTRIRVHALTPLWRGKGRDVGVRVQIGGPDVVPATLESRFRQRPVFAVLGLPALIAVLVLAVGLSIALPTRAGAPTSLCRRSRPMRAAPASRCSRQGSRSPSLRYGAPRYRKAKSSRPDRQRVRECRGTPSSFSTSPRARLPAMRPARPGPPNPRRLLQPDVAQFLRSSASPRTPLDRQFATPASVTTPCTSTADR